MELLVFGHAGARVLVFPTSMGRFYEWEDRGMTHALGDQLERGWIQMFCVDSIDRETWYNNGWEAHGRAWWHSHFDDYVYREVLPFTRSVNDDPFMISVGASFGAYHAVNFALRHPESVGRVLGMSGFYDIRRFADGRSDGDIYFNNPVAYLANEQDPHRLGLLQRMNIILAVGRDDQLLESNQHLSQILWDKGIWHALRTWDGLAHDWPDWASMLHLYLSGNV